MIMQQQNCVFNELLRRVVRTFGPNILLDEGFGFRLKLDGHT